MIQARIDDVNLEIISVRGRINIVTLEGVRESELVSTNGFWFVHKNVDFTIALVTERDGFWFSRRAISICQHVIKCKITDILRPVMREIIEVQLLLCKGVYPCNVLEGIREISGDKVQGGIVAGRLNC